MKRIDRIDSKGNIREHLTENGAKTLCGLDLSYTQEASHNLECKRCLMLAKPPPPSPINASMCPPIRWW